jgi:hypothetical protein
MLKSNPKTVSDNADNVCFLSYFEQHSSAINRELKMHQGAMLSGVLGYGLISYAMACVPYELVMIPLQWLCKLRYHSLHRKEDCQKLQKNVTLLSSWTRTGSDGKGFGYSLSLSYYIYLNYIASDGGSYSAQLVCSNETLNLLLKETDEPTVENISSPKPMSSPTYKVLKKSSGNYAHAYYRKSQALLPLYPTATQLSILETIEKSYREKKRAVAFISGPPNTGKSMIGPFLANRMHGVYTSDFAPWTPGDALGLLECEHEASETSPIIVCLDEVDEALVKISNGKIVPNDRVMTLASDKRGWNTLLDNVERGLHPFMILVLTSNKTKESIDDLCGDDSFLRNNRVSNYFTMDEEMVVSRRA